jgi:RHS repeat-associated protein
MLGATHAYDGDQVIAAYDGSGTLLRKFIYGPGIDEPIGMVDVADANETYFYHFDGLGSIVALSDMNNVLVERYTYDVFGQPTIRDVNGTEIASSAVGNPYAFTGRRYDPEAGLYYYRTRYYDFATGRFLQPDPLGYTDGLNLYAYVANGPVSRVDPHGLKIKVRGGIVARFAYYRAIASLRRSPTFEATYDALQRSPETIIVNVESWGSKQPTKGSGPLSIQREVTFNPSTWQLC